MTNDNEEEQLHSVALQNSQSILLARRRAEEALRKQSEWLRVTLASIGDGVISTDVEGQVTFMNGVAEELTGWPQSEALGRPLPDVFQIINEQSRQPVENPVLRALREGAVMGLANHTLLIAKDGTERPIDDSAAPIRDERNTVAGCVLVFRDVTEPHKAEQALRESQAQLQTLFDRAPLGIYLIDADFCIRQVNPTALSVFGDIPDLIGRDFDEVIHILWPKEYADDVVRIFRHTLETGEPNITPELIQERLDRGVTEYYEWQINRIPLPDGRHGVVCYFRDISAQVRAREVIKESEARFRAAVEVVSSLIWTNNAQGMMEGEQPGWGNFTGQTVEQYQGYGWSKALHPEDAQPTIEAWNQSVAEKKIFVFEHRVRRRDGEWRLCSVRAVPVLTDKGVIREWVGVHTDITDLRRDEETLKDADRRKNEFLAMLAHELRNPLAPIRNALQIVRLSEGNDEAVKSASEIMERQISQMVRLVDDLLDVSRITRGKIELRRERVELASVINQAVETSRPAIESVRHELMVTLPPQPVYLHADLVRLAQVFSNLLNNSSKYSEPNGRISLIAEQQDGDVVVSVKDTGVGIPLDMLPKIFEMFTQVDRSLERSQGGLGIGLSLVQRLVEMHGGSVSAFSEGPDRGSEFIVRLPVLEEMNQPVAEPAASESATTPVRRFLVVDDNRDSAESMAMWLTLTGNETHTAFDGLEAVEAATAFRPDVVLLDIGLPKLNGYEAARKIRQQPWGKTMVLVALTGWGQEEDRRQSKEAGFNGHLVKPVDFDDLMKLLAEIDASAKL